MLKASPYNDEQWRLNANLVDPQVSFMSPVHDGSPEQ